MAIYKALLEVQKELKPVTKTSDDPFYKSKYADLEAIVEAVMPILNKHGVVAVQYTKWLDKGPAVYTELVDVETGEKTTTELPIICKDSSDPQKVIAGLTYMRRASLACACGLATQDDDGNSAAGKEKDEYKKPQQKQPVPELPKKGYQEQPNHKLTPTKVINNTSTHEWKIVTAKDEYYTSREIVAKICNMNMNKELDAVMTVDNEMRKIIKEIILF